MSDILQVTIIQKERSFAAQPILLLEMKEVTLTFLHFPKFLLLALETSDKIRVNVHHQEVYPIG